MSGETQLLCDAIARENGELRDGHYHVAPRLDEVLRILGQPQYVRKITATNTKHETCRKARQTTQVHKKYIRDAFLRVKIDSVVHCAYVLSALVQLLEHKQTNVVTVK
jgi:hypothetical protein